MTPTPTFLFWRSAAAGRAAAAAGNAALAAAALDTLHLLAQHAAPPLAVRAREAHAQITCACRARGMRADRPGALDSLPCDVEPAS